MELVLVFILGLGSSFLSNIAGGGGALLTLPALLALGVPAVEAVGTQKLGAIGLVTGSSISTRHKHVVRQDHLLPLIGIGVVASLIGPQVALKLDEESVKVITSILIATTALVSLFTWQIAGHTRQMKRWQIKLGYFAYLITLTTQAAFAAGIGVLSSYVLIGLIGMSAIESVSTRRIIGLVILPLQLIIFGLAGEINYALGLALLAGTIIGGFAGMKLAIDKGSEFVKRAMAVVSLALVVSLFI